MSNEWAKGRIQGYCPMGCGETLFIGSEGYVTCSLIGCPDPSAISLRILCERDVSEHILNSDRLRRAIIEAQIDKAIRERQG